VANDREAEVIAQLRIDPRTATTVLHRLLHPHLRHHIHLRSLNVTVDVWLLLLWVAIVPAAWLLWRFVYVRRPPNLRLALVLLGDVVVLQTAGFIAFALDRDANLLFSLLWCSLLSLLAGLALLPILRFGGDDGPRPRTGAPAPSGEAGPAPG
jgi:hypothetical protein